MGKKEYLPGTANKLKGLAERSIGGDGENGSIEPAALSFECRVFGFGLLRLASTLAPPNSFAVFACLAGN